MVINIGVKYCGGCNPKYTRSLIPKRIKEEFPQVHLEPVEYSHRYDYVLIVCGCEAECITEVEIRERCEVLQVFSLADYEMVRERLRKHEYEK